MESFCNIQTTDGLQHLAMHRLLQLAGCGLQLSPARRSQTDSPLQPMLHRHALPVMGWLGSRCSMRSQPWARRTEKISDDGPACTRMSAEGELQLHCRLMANNTNQLKGTCVSCCIGHLRVWCVDSDKGRTSQSNSGSGAIAQLR